MTLNQLINFAKEKGLDFDTELVFYKKGMEFSTYKSLSSLNIIKLRKVEKQCSDAFDGTRYYTTVFEKESFKTNENLKTVLEVSFNEELNKNS